MTKPRFVLLAASLILAASLPRASRAADDGKTIGRARVTTLRGAATTNAESVSAALAARSAPAAGKRFADKRVISVQPRSDDPTRFDATNYDYTVEKAFDLVLDTKGKELSRKAIADQPARDGRARRRRDDRTRERVLRAGDGEGGADGLRADARRHGRR